MNFIVVIYLLIFVLINRYLINIIKRNSIELLKSKNVDSPILMQILNKSPKKKITSIYSLVKDYLK